VTRWASTTHGNEAPSAHKNGRGIQTP